jgi:hypothetical protein
MELSTDASARARIGKARGCILLLVTLLGNAASDPESAAAARKLLATLSDDLQNVVQMAEANYFKPLVHSLLHGTFGHCPNPSAYPDLSVRFDSVVPLRRSVFGVLWRKPARVAA